MRFGAPVRVGWFRLSFCVADSDDKDIDDDDERFSSSILHGAFRKNSGFWSYAVIGPLFSPSTAAPSIHRLALTLVSDGACGFAGAGMLSASAARQFV